MKITIDGKICEAEPGEFILEVARRNNIYIPTLCHSDALPGLASCRLCIVEVIDRGRSKVVTSCIFPISKEVEVVTNSYKIRRMRKNIVMLLQARCPANKEVAELARAFEVEQKRVKRFKLDMEENCILCGLCARACKELGAGAISTVNRGIYKKVSTPYGDPSPDCIGCASCANVCPTNAIKVVDWDGERKIWGKKFKMVKCDLCGKYFATEEHVKYAYSRLNMDPPEKLLCSTCKKKIAAKDIKDIFETV
ncbi:2Fe-2S iron-sulfur cluster-binding protein [Clostridium sp. WLY-B-L2]|uniref:Ferredoxin n=1 Tax=Clostridium aromativorans TaxID=2836848 RepID=A0ABS8N5T4_9CLOT|nr:MULTISPECIES: 2Fe-2S iron-sulfur cluster-binding protein [Clostridium]KAA8676541.1 2Fe-2S iron-sulfur cluster binding domain-containing protein [Clostridium sp. HV4-5-A1G]MCC9294108.1 2Fe-2S iron-sulfur cluster-binding protein [Clostridium aromativorans]CAB1239737.1 putative NADP-reducing hydrogenase subunit HndD [Clostridiaceae bacterium BL-3]